MEFVKYNSIDNSYRGKTIQYIYNNDYDKLTWSVSEKIHGANFSFWMNKDGLRIAKRSCFIGGDDNFYNCQSILKMHREQLSMLYKFVAELYDIPQEDLEVVLYGEIFGGSYPHPDVPKSPNATCVQRGVYYTPDNDFYAFDLKVNGKFINVNVFEELMKQLGFIYAHSLFEGSFEDCLKFTNEFTPNYPQFMGLPPIDDNVCEGVVLKPIESQYFPSGSRVILKNKNDKFAEVTTKPKKTFKKIELNDVEKDICADLCNYLTENRLRNVISKIGVIEQKMFNKLKGLFVQDALEDFAKDSESFGDLEKDSVKKIKSLVDKEAAGVVRENFINIIDGLF